ncbi:hypothetical protein HMPREF9194_01725 [Treponema maltophilum ATCC 51939]|uniref:Uncharacterized protein n=1 Tax=Treponema maltophilum ATCC 51939 TaxID=1125699 RepID=S3L3L0_TREMA|nr:hypothetical protein HMPREF9194_01725 [Treponema maltophilum ATCC 51939]
MDEKIELPKIGGALLAVCFADISMTGRKT